MVVVGDIGRSPRMQYHALSFAESDFLVEFIGYTGELFLDLHLVPSSIQLFSSQRQFALWRMLSVKLFLLQF